MEPYFGIGLFFTGLIGVLGFLIRDWKKTWESRVLAHDKRLEDHGKTLNAQAVLNAKITGDIEHIKKTGDETRLDVKKLLSLNGKRSTG